jgi:hypothetical protein
MSYYQGNALYRYIREKKLKNFKFTTGNIWQLIYGNSKSDPVLLVLAVGLPNTSNPVPLNSDIEDAWTTMKDLSEKSRIPLVFVQFANNIVEIESVNVSTDGKSFQKLTMGELTASFHKYGLPTSNTPTRKAKNDKESSAYHTWQRENLGKDLTVTDIDLWKLDASGNLTTIFELKRSRIPLKEWQPYPVDFKNFILILKVCKLAGIKFKISYNFMSPYPPRDEDISKIKVFNLDFTTKLFITEEGIYTLTEFITT